MPTDKAKAVLAVLADPKRGEWSDHQIAFAAGVSPSTVGVVRRNARRKDTVRLGADGKRYSAEARKPPPSKVSARLRPRTFAEHLLRLREQSKLTCRQVSHRLGVTVPTVERWESGSARPGDSLLLALALLFDVSPAVFLQPLNGNARGASTP